MSKDFETEVVRRVFDNRQGGCVTVGPDRDGLSCIEVYTEGKGAEVFGPVRLVMEPNLARLVAKALVDACDDVEREPTP